MAEQQQRWSTPDTTVRLQDKTVDDQAIEIEDRTHLNRLRRRSRRITALVLVSLVGVVGLIGLAVAFDHYFIPGQSMEPTIASGDRIISNKLSYQFGDINRGDIVVFEASSPEGAATYEAVQRVVGLPGETIEIVDGVVFIDGSQLSEPYLESTFVEQVPPLQIPIDQYFLMGDNRGSSNDSRSSSTVERSDIKARAIRIFWPLGRQASL